MQIFQGFVDRGTPHNLAERSCATSAQKPALQNLPFLRLRQPPAKQHAFRLHDARPVVWSRLRKMARDQLDCEVEEVALVEAGGVLGNACQQGVA
jgi:hypothetical protein